MTIYAGYGKFDPGELRTVSVEFIDRLIREAHNEAIEQCALVAEEHDSDALSWTENGRKVVKSDVADAIRALKDKP